MTPPMGQGQSSGVDPGSRIYRNSQDYYSKLTYLGKPFVAKNIPSSVSIECNDWTNSWLHDKLTLAGL